MKSTKHTRSLIFSLVYAAVIFVFIFMYYIFYRTQSRVNWYKEMSAQSENMITEFKDATGIKSPHP
jgi:hypothetical protein